MLSEVIQSVFTWSRGVKVVNAFPFRLLRSDNSLRYTFYSICPLLFKSITFIDLLIKRDQTCL